MYWNTPLLLVPLLPLVSGSGVRLGQPTNFESVSSEPLTFEEPRQDPIPRRQAVDDGEEAVGPVWVNEFEVVDSEGWGVESVGEPKLAGSPIARKMRKLDTPVEEEDMGEHVVTEAGLPMDAPIDMELKESFRDSSIPLLELTPVDQEDRDLSQTCAGDQKYFKLDLTTDNSGWETTWVLKKDGSQVQKGPPGNTNYADNTRYAGGFCLSPGSYEFTIYDRFQDGICCNNGRGKYSITLNGNSKGKSPSGGGRWASRTHSFNIKSVSSGGSSGSSNGGSSSGSSASLPAASISRGGCQNVQIKFTIDKYGRETTVQLTGRGGTELSSVNEVDAYQTKVLSKCVSPGDYTFRLADNDGLCCSNGQGSYELSVDGTVLITGGYFIGSKSYTVKIGYDWQSGMSSRDWEWLNAHNSRRQTYHRDAGVSYRPVRWSSTLAQDARNYANQLLSTCNTAGIDHAKMTEEGENLAKNKGKGSWGAMYDADKIMGRWVENEASMGYPSNAHLTQVIWRATSYIGCGESEQGMSNGDTCRIQVCRYAKAGNCAVKNGNWRAEAFKDDTGCGPVCVREGCYA